jgi:hypothetical protein
MIKTLIEVGCKRVDLFFMVGLPNQTYQSVMDTVSYCGELLEKFGTNGNRGKVLPLIAPLAPFIDPGSIIFEDPEKYGYRFFAKTLKEHRQAMLRPSWKFSLNYETKWMTRDEIVKATYDGALKLLAIKKDYGVISRRAALKIRDHLERAIILSEKIIDPEHIDDELRKEIFSMNTLDSVCGKHELDWPTKGWKLNLPNIMKLVFSEVRQDLRSRNTFSPLQPNKSTSR